MAEQEEKKDDMLDTGAAFSTAVIGVCLAISSIFGGNAGDDMMISRGLANNQWSYFQAKSTKQALYEVNRKMFETNLSNPTLDKNYRQEIEKKLADFDKKVAKYELEKDTIKLKAESFEQMSEDAASKQDYFDYGEAFYQIAIVLAAIGMISKSRNLWYLSMVLGAIAIGISAYGFFL